MAWHPVHEGSFASGGSDGSVIFWTVGAEKEVGVIEQAHESIVWCLVWHPVGHILTTGSNDHTVKFWSRNRPGDSMRDRYNLNTLPPGQEEDYGNLADLAGGGGGSASVFDAGRLKASSASFIGSAAALPIIPGMAPEDKVEGDVNARPSIPGLDFQEVIEEPKKQPYAKPIPKTFMANWHEAERIPEPDRGIKRPFGDRDGGGGFPGGLPPAVEGRKENMPPITLYQLQQEATAVVVFGQILPIHPGSSLQQAIPGGEAAIREVLHRDYNISTNMPPHQQMFPGGGGGGGMHHSSGVGAMAPPPPMPPPPQQQQQGYGGGGGSSNFGNQSGYGGGGGGYGGGYGGGGGGGNYGRRDDNFGHRGGGRHHSNNWGGGGRGGGGRM